MTRSQPLLQAREISKAFGGSRALSNVSLTLAAGEVHALLGENGAGKSTLGKILGGVYRPDTGGIWLEGRALTFASPADAMQHGIALLHQEPLIFPDLDIAENIFLGRQPEGGIPRRIRWRALYDQARELLLRLGLRLDPRTPMRHLSVANQQMIEMARALLQQARIFILDEPTASLSPGEVADLFRIVRQLREEGAALVFIGHRLEEVFAISDRITVLRDGEYVGTTTPAETSPEEIVRMMVGRPLSTLYEHESSAPGEVRLRVEGLGRAGVFEDITFEARAGEIVGMAGLVGAGRTQIAEALFGIAPPDAGTVTLDGQPVAIRSPEQAIRLGLAYVPEDRQRHGLLLPLPIAQNITLPRLREFARAGWILRQREWETAQTYSQRLQVRGSRGVEQPVGELSGGNQQKVSLAKWLLTQPRLLILDEPTRGIDVGAKAEIYHLMGELAHQGMAILMISSELPEILAMSDRILVLREGRITGRFDRGAATQEAIMAAATGTT
jgi:rhamnose transport system ATP-binding protein